MTGISRYLVWLVAMFLSATFNATSAAIVTLTFDTLPFNHVTTTNSVEHGFRISPSCHMHIAPGDQQDNPNFDSQVLSYDQSGCLEGGLINPDYLGEPISGQDPGGPAEVYIDFFEQPFSFISFQHAGTGVEITSSKGGSYGVDDSAQGCDGAEVCDHVLDGPEWNGVKWILLGDSHAGAIFFVFDNLVFRVPGGQLPAPNTLALLILGLASLGIALRRRAFSAAKSTGRL